MLEFTAPAAGAGTVVRGVVASPNDPNHANDEASVTYQPGATPINEYFDGPANDGGCSASGARSRGASAWALVAGVLGLGVLMRRRDRKS